MWYVPIIQADFTLYIMLIAHIFRIPSRRVESLLRYAPTGLAVVGHNAGENLTWIILMHNILTSHSLLLVTFTHYLCDMS